MKDSQNLQVNTRTSDLDQNSSLVLFGELTVLRYNGSDSSSSEVFSSRSVIGWKAELLDPDRLCRTLRAARLTSCTGEVRQHSTDGTTDTETQRGQGSCGGHAEL